MHTKKEHLSHTEDSEKKDDLELEADYEARMPALPPHTGIANDELRELVGKNIKWSQVIYNQNRKIKHRLTLMVVGSYIRLALILAPIILAIIYLPPILKNVLGQYQEMFQSSGVKIDNIGQLLEQFQPGALNGISQEQIEQYLNQNR